MSIQRYVGEGGLRDVMATVAHPSPTNVLTQEKHVLARDELSKMFCSEAGWSVLQDQIVKDSDHGRTLVNFVAVKN